MTSTRALRRTLITTGAAATLSLLAPFAANAQVLTDTDPTGDKYGTDPAGYVALPENTTADVTGTVLTHNDTRIKVRVNFEDLVVPETESDGVTISVKFRTDADIRGTATLSITDGEVVTSALQRANGDYSCSDRTNYSIDYFSDYAWVSFPRDCIGNPTWLRVQVETVVDTFGESPTKDDALSDVPLSADKPRLTWSPRLYTGTTVPLVRRTSETNTDPAGDVFKDYWTDDLFTIDAPDRTNGDIISSTVTHKENRIAGLIEFADLVADPTESFSITAYFTTATGEGLLTLSYRTPTAGTDGDVDWFAFYNSDLVTEPCNINQAIDYEANTVSFSFPRSCLHRPDWVKVSLGATSDGGSRYLEENPRYYYQDFAMVEGYDANYYYTKRLYRP